MAIRGKRKQKTVTVLWQPKSAYIVLSPAAGRAEAMSGLFHGVPTEAEDDVVLIG